MTGNTFTLKSLIEEHARLDFSNFLSTLLAIFHVINEKFQPSRLSIYLINKQTGWNFFQAFSFILVCSSIRDFRVSEVEDKMPNKSKERPFKLRPTPKLCRNSKKRPNSLELSEYAPYFSSFTRII